eukprot:m.7771 g.7771  ORF g.7771 m.7771 type:complete len:70 (-) comp2477_c0_seq1:58-267(-)
MSGRDMQVVGGGGDDVCGRPHDSIHTVSLWKVNARQRHGYLFIFHWTVFMQLDADMSCNFMMCSYCAQF